MKNNFCAFHNCKETPISDVWLELISNPVANSGLCVTNWTDEMLCVSYTGTDVCLHVPPKTGFVLDALVCDFVKIKAFNQPITNGYVSCFIW